MCHRDRFITNYTALKSIHGAISLEEYKRVLPCSTSKDAWYTLERTHEGTSIVKSSKFQMLTHQFENLKMKSDKTCKEFYMRMNDFVKPIRGLGE